MVKSYVELTVTRIQINFMVLKNCILVFRAYIISFNQIIRGCYCELDLVQQASVLCNEVDA